MRANIIEGVCVFLFMSALAWLMANMVVSAWDVESANRESRVKLIISALEKP